MDENVVDPAMETEVVAEEVSSEPAVQAEPEFEVPEKYKGKSQKQIFDELEHANKSMGRYANELGELRKLTDELIKSQLKPSEKAEKPQEVDFFEDPREATRRQIEMNPEVQEAKNLALQAVQAQRQMEFQRRHPDSGEVLADPGFAEWIGKSKVRQDLFQRAHRFDLDAADELFSTYKELKAVRAAKQQENVSATEKEARDKTLKAASVGSGGTGESGKKIMRRADILKIMQNPHKYTGDVRREIELAYAEGRVR